MKYVILLLCLLLFSSIKADIQKIPEKDALKIKSLFEYLIQEHDFAYAIFGSKPMSLADICLWMPDLPPHKQLNARLLLVKKRENLNAWYKYKNEFNFKENYIFLDKEEDLIRGVVIILINEKNMLCCLKENEIFFKNELGNSFVPEVFLQKIKKKEISLAKAINYNYGLLGIMLGYGVRNSMLFQEKLNLLEQIARNKKVLSIENELEKKLKKIESQLQPFNEFEDFSLIMPLHFRADVIHPETIALKKRYKNDQQKIAELMKKPNFIDRTLDQLMK